MTFSSAIVRRLTITIALVAAVSAVSSCSKKPKSDEDTANNAGPAASADENQMGDSDSGKAMGLQTVHFPYDSFSIGGDAKSTLKANADILKSNAGVKVQIEGHCDQRGGIQYNIALGEKRANAVKKYLEGAGISGERVTTISYGKERPVDATENEAAYGKNRRANFAITSK